MTGISVDRRGLLPHSELDLYSKGKAQRKKKKKDMLSQDSISVSFKSA